MQLHTEYARAKRACTDAFLSAQLDRFMCSCNHRNLKLVPYARHKYELSYLMFIFADVDVAILSFLQAAARVLREIPDEVYVRDSRPTPKDIV